MTNAAQTSALPEALEDLPQWAVTEICDQAVRALRDLRRKRNRSLLASDRAPFRWAWGDDFEAPDAYELVARLSNFRVLVETAAGQPVCSRWQ